MIGALPSKPRAPYTSKTVNGSRVNGYWWKTDQIKTILQEHAVIIENEEGDICLNPSLTGIYPTDSSFFTVPPLSISTLPPSYFLPNYGPREIHYLDGHWTHQFHKGIPFKPSYEVATAILNNSSWDDGCLRFDAGTKENGYVTVTDWWLSKVFPDGSITKADIASPTASRLVAMVMSPMEIKDWGSFEGKGKHAHHLCNTRNCVHPKHLMIVDSSAHKFLHMVSREEHHPVFTAAVSATSATF